MVSREGITKDLEALAAQGIGRVMIMQMPEQSPYPRQWSFCDYPGKVRCLSDEWFGLVNFAVGECDRLGLQMAIFFCPGWGHVGGPWVPPEKGLKQLAATTVRTRGPARFDQILARPPPAPVVSGGNQVPPWNKSFSLLPQPRENFFRDEAVLALPDLGPGAPIPLEKVVNLTNRLGAQERLIWEVPAGDWTIWRLCLVSENGVNHPAPPEAIGLEADRMDPAAVRLVFDGMVGRILREARAKGYRSFHAFETDSYETGYQDFGLDYREQFRRRRSYDCTPWLPAWRTGGGQVQIGSAEQTARFRFDMQRTISELWAERFHGTLRRLADENDVGWMTEPYFKVPLDWTASGGLSTMPGAEFWVGEGGSMGMNLGTAPEIAAVYGHKIAWAEAFTAEAHHSAWRNDPWILKRSGDAAFALGINLFYLHGFVHNPFPDEYRPGLTMGYWGTQFSRHLTWWSFSRGWHDYLARCQSLLQEGRAVFPLLLYPAKIEPNPKMSPAEYRSARIPDELLLRRLAVHDGRLVFPHGAEFAALTLSGDALRPEALAKIKELVAAGAVLLANPPPRRSPSLENYPAADAQVARLIDEIWGADAGDRPVDRRLGRGRVIAGVSLEEGMRRMSQRPDFLYEPNNGGPRPALLSHHRVVGEARLWFVSHQGHEPARVRASFAVSGLQPEWWDPVEGTTHDLPAFRFAEGRTVVPLEFAPWQSGFVVFRRPVRAPEGGGSNWPVLAAAGTVSGPWEVTFDPRWGGPHATVAFPQLADWSQHAERGIRYYSGSATYRTTFAAPGASPAAIRFLDLGVVRNLARVRLNGRDLGVVWCAPWRAEIPPGLLRAAGNSLEIEVVNTWVNRLIGDEFEPDDFETEPGNQTGNRLGSYDLKVKSRGLKELPDWLIKREPRPSKGRFTFASWFFYDKEAPLQPSGLLGPVTLETVRAEPLVHFSVSHRIPTLPHRLPLHSR